MDTVANTQEAKRESGSRKLSSRKKKLKLYVLEEARAMRASRSAYYGHGTLFDYALEDAGLLQGLFASLNDFKRLRLEGIVAACTYFMVHSDCGARAKEDLGEDLRRMQGFFSGLSNFQGLISEKAFYYEGLWEKLEQLAECPARGH